MKAKRSVVPPTLETTLPSLKQEWMDTLLSTEPSDKNKAEAAVDMAYSSAGFIPPKNKVWIGSPISASIEILKKKEIIWINDDILKQTEKIARLYLTDTVSLPLIREIRNHLSDDLTERKCHNVRRAIVSEIWNDKTQKALQKTSTPFTPWYNFQLYDALMPWVSGLEIIKGLVDLSKSCGWCWFSLNTAYMCERPVSLYFEHDNKLHHLISEAITYPDGSAIAMWHGKRIDRSLIKNRETLSPDEILATKNVETRRVMMEIYLEVHGAENILTAFKAKILDDAPCLGLERKLVRIGRKDLFLFCTNGSIESDGTRRKFLLHLPAKQTKREKDRFPQRDVTTAHQASAWTYGINPKKYQEQVRT